MICEHVNFIQILNLHIKTNSSFKLRNRIYVISDHLHSTEYSNKILFNFLNLFKILNNAMYEYVLVKFTLEN